jgi:hypothetical protein
MFALLQANHVMKRRLTGVEPVNPDVVIKILTSSRRRLAELSHASLTNSPRRSRISAMPLGVVHEGLTPDQRPGPEGKCPGRLSRLYPQDHTFGGARVEYPPRAMTKHSDTPTTENAIIATLATATRACVALLLALAAAHGAGELLGAF